MNDDEHLSEASGLRRSDDATTALKSERHAVALIHGIRTFGAWQRRVKAWLESESNGAIHAVPVKYGYFNLFKLLSPISRWRNQAVEVVLQGIRGVQGAHPTASLSVIAHSFGAYCICRILLEHPNVRLRMLVLCGGVAPTNYPWWLVRSTMRQDVCNHHSPRDPWPAVGASLSIRYAAIGTFGATECHGLVNVEEPKGHGDYFSQENAARWARQIVEGSSGKGRSFEGGDKGWTSVWGATVLGLIKLTKWLVASGVVLSFAWATVRIHDRDPLSGRWSGTIRWSPEFAEKLINFDGAGRIPSTGLFSDGAVFLAKDESGSRWRGLSRWRLCRQEDWLSDLCVATTATAGAGEYLWFIAMETGFRKLSPFAESRISYAPFFKYRFGVRKADGDRLSGDMLVDDGAAKEQVVGEVELER